MSRPHSVQKYDAELTSSVSPSRLPVASSPLHTNVGVVAQGAAVTRQQATLVYSPSKSAIITAARETGGLFARQLDDMLEKRTALDEAIAAGDEERARLAAEALAHSSASLDGAALDLYDAMTYAAGRAAANELTDEVLAS
ncbi:MAG: hypothetical protein JWM95_4023 [Gemmatimonadetes bacterium]|nr:hypothetical protein [Gemmatimonadota bacterium]